ncbi:DUF11 domain-containing protein, partial [Patescibacteria group bacterium]
MLKIRLIRRTPSVVKGIGRKTKTIKKAGIVLLALLVAGGFLFAPNLTHALSDDTGHEVRFDVRVPNLNASTLDASPRQTRIGTVVTYTIVVRNDGIATATGANVLCPVPNYTSYVAGSITGTGADDSNPNVLAWNIGALNVNQSTTLTFKLLMSSSTPDATIISVQAQIFCNELCPTLTSDPQNPTPFSPTTVTVYREAVTPAGVIPPGTGTSILQALLALFLTTFIVRQIYRHRQRVKSQPAV